MAENNINIYIFDVDDTLIDTKARIRAVDHNGNVCFTAGTKVFNSPDSKRLLKPGQTWDFTEFESLEQLMSERKRKPFELLKRLNPVYNHIFIITARQCKPNLYKWLSQNGIDTKQVKVYCYDHHSPTVAEYKAQMLTSIVSSVSALGAPKVHILEDNEENIEAMVGACGVLGVPYQVMDIA